MRVATEINFGIIKEYDGLTGDELRSYAMKSYQDLEAHKENNDYNKFEHLMSEYLTQEQADVMEGLDLPEVA